MKIKLQLKNIVRSDAACIKLGLNPWCINEGANGDDWIEMELSSARHWGLI